MESKELQTPSAISILSQDVLLEILFRVRDLYYEQQKTRFCHDAAAVSSSWRDLLHSTPLWWNDLYVPYLVNLDLIRRHLTLGKETTLRLQLVEPNILYNANKLVDLIVLHLKRCWYICFEGEADKETAFHLTGSILSNPDLPLLRHLTVNIVGKANNEVNIATRLSTWKSLTTLRLGGSMMMNWTHPESPMPHLTHLHLARARGTFAKQIRFSNFGKVLLLCPNLTLLALYDDILSYPLEVQDERITHNHLESILILGNMLNVSEFLVYVDAPKLRELVISPVVAGDFRRLDDLPLSACQNKFRSLTKLTLGLAHYGAVTEWHKVSDYFPNVNTLLFVTVYTVEFKKLFMRRPWMFPNMTHLGVTDVNEAFVSIVMDLAGKKKEQCGGAGVRLQRLSLDSQSYKKARGVVEQNEGLLGRLGLDVVCADLWEEQRLQVLYTRNKGMFVGETDVETDSDSDDY
ncbi:hypothetical protein CVT24_000607 [Panaeolus cyanescens]|uniref:F-box domain-containing protein n=1 Tax=Panaeolus cyanescens TaxID=181874 RepID=A0A409YTF6_9AGAR|nr:hypothetical protein CVT24_000607 [Panaeolus cyanescens]